MTRPESAGRSDDRVEGRAGEGRANESSRSSEGSRSGEGDEPRRRRRRRRSSREGSASTRGEGKSERRESSSRSRSGDRRRRSSESRSGRERAPRADFSPVAGRYDEDDEGLEFLGVEDAVRDGESRPRPEDDDVLEESGLGSVLDVPSWVEAIGIVIAGNLAGRSKGRGGRSGP
jgi:hypothetical protein